MWRFIWRTVMWVLIVFFVSSFLAVLAYKWLPVKYTPLMFIRAHEQWTSSADVVMEHDWIDIDSIPHDMAQAVIAGEDAHFMEHNGFDFKEIYRARLEALEGGRERGASTISQQTAKNVFLWPGHSWFRKGLEAYFTVLIEWMWGKERIMEVYLNSIEMGDGVYGIRAVAARNWDKTPIEMTRKECALVAASLPNPRTMDSSHPNARLTKRQQRILHEMNFVEDANIGYEE
ncbi:MAG: monofunctional biosynthetic peptidoglycan transglycosylase [Muribaculaceae bacterium]|nr:monofunctional biosynthetic peptidoglycan transglycosylase [Muribaculaceae bacterium]